MSSDYLWNFQKFKKIIREFHDRKFNKIKVYMPFSQKLYKLEHWFCEVACWLAQLWLQLNHFSPYPCVVLLQMYNYRKCLFYTYLPFLLHVWTISSTVELVLSKSLHYAMTVSIYLSIYFSVRPLIVSEKN